MKKLIPILLLFLIAAEVNSQESTLIEIPHCPGGEGCGYPFDGLMKRTCSDIRSCLAVSNNISVTIIEGGPMYPHCENESEAIVVVGEVISAAKSDESCEEFLSKRMRRDSRFCISRGRVFDYKYKIKEKIQGPTISNVIEFTGYYNPPLNISLNLEQLMLDNSLIILTDTEQGYTLQAAEGVEPFNGVWGSGEVWAVCEKWHEREYNKCVKYTPVPEYLKTLCETSQNAP